MKLSAEQFKNAKHKRLTLLGMSGVGKTHLAKMLSKDGEWFHYSSDYRIGAGYMNDAILDNIKNRVKQDRWLAKLLDSESISLQNHISFDNLSSVSHFLGKVGNPEQGGLPIDEFNKRQALHKKAETGAMLDVAKFIKKSTKQGFNHFINDAGGSLCELDDTSLYQMLSKHTLILYIRASKASELTLIERAKAHPKPLYYQHEFLTTQLNTYLAENALTYVAQIDPDAFVGWIFPHLLRHRTPKYEAIAQKYGCIIDSEDIYQCSDANEVLTLIEKTIKCR